MSENISWKIEKEYWGYDNETLPEGKADKCETIGLNPFESQNHAGCVTWANEPKEGAMVTLNVNTGEIINSGGES